jgi:hypothetical protein
MKRLTTGAAATIALLLAGFTATAHHSGAAYFDLQSTIEHTNATVVSYDLVNPHSRWSSGTPHSAAQTSAA